MIDRIPLKENVTDSSVLYRELQKTASTLESLDTADLLCKLGTSFLERSETQAVRVRDATTWTDVLSHMQECYLLYWAAKRSLLWARAAYKQRKLAVPEAIWKEHQIVEEYQVDCGIFLLTYGWRSFLGPTMSLELSRLALIEGIYGYAGRTPHYPKLLLQCWLRAAERSKADVELHRDELLRVVFDEVEQSFADKIVVQAAISAASTFRD